jgi:hypothetical protein
MEQGVGSAEWGVGRLGPVSKGASAGIAPPRSSIRGQGSVVKQGSSDEGRSGAELRSEDVSAPEVRCEAGTSKRAETA